MTTIREYLHRLNAIPTYAENQTQREKIVDELLTEHPDYMWKVMLQQLLQNGFFDSPAKESKGETQLRT